MASTRDNTIKATFAVTIVVFLSKGLGFVREMVMAHYFGTGMYKEAYIMAYSVLYIPILLVTSCVTSTMVPMYTRTQMRGGEKEASRFASNVLNVFLMFSVVIGLVMALFMPAIMRGISGYSGERLALSIQLAQMMMPALALSTVSIVLSAVLNARRQFIPSQLMGFPLSIAGIVAAVLFVEPAGKMYGISGSVVVAGMMQIVILIPFLREGFTYSARLNVRDPLLKRMLALSGPAIMSMAVNELNHMIDRMLAARLSPGDVSALDYAFKLITFALGVLIVPLTTVLFSRMSERAAKKDYRGIGMLVTDSIETLSLIVLPIMVLSVVLGEDIIRLVYQRGAFDAKATQVTALAFSVYAAGILSFGLRDVFSRAFNALENTRIPMLTAFFTVGLNIVLNLILSRFIGMAGLALATVVSGTAGAVIMLYLLRKRLGHMRLIRTLGQEVRMLIAAGLCALAASSVARILPDVHVFLHLAVCSGAALLVYAMVVIGLGVRQVRGLGSMMKSIVRK